MVTGRQLDISDPSQTVEGETNQIFVDRFNLQKTGFDEIAGLEDKRLTLEVQFYNEVFYDFVWICIYDYLGVPYCIYVVVEIGFHVKSVSNLGYPVSTWTCNN